MAVHAERMTPDSQAIALLCTTLALPRGTATPLRGAEWSKLAALIRDADLRPAHLLAMDAEEIERAIGVPSDLSHRLEALLRRGGQLAFELERLANRGISLLTRADDAYPSLYKERLRQAAPPALYAAGDVSLLRLPGAAVVGSRDASPASLDFAGAIGRRLAGEGRAVISGAARGVDTAAMTAGLEAGGPSVGVVADSLEKAIRRLDLRDHVSAGALVLLSAYHPSARFTVGGAMARNRLIYCLAEEAYVVSSGEKGGTREGALENLKAGWVPLFVWADREAPAANHALLEAGGIPIDSRFGAGAGAAVRPPEPVERDALVGSRQSTDPGSSPDLRVVDAFDLVWPVLEDFLRTSRTLPEVRAHLDVEPGQAKAWLAKAVDRGFVVELRNPRRFQVPPPQPLALFETSGE